jgi:tetratricopeptide (TPR) repeat protein
MKNKQLSLPRNEVDSVFALYLDNKFQDAINKIKDLNDRYPNEPLLFNLIGACYKELGHLEGAAKMFEAAVSINPKYAEAHFNLGVIYQALDRLEDAVDSYMKAIAITPNYPEAYNNLGTSLYELGRIQSSIENLEWAIAYKHDFSEAHNNLGRSLNDFGRVRDAIKSFKEAITHNPNYTKAYFNLALSLKDIGDKEGFLKNIEKTLDIKPEWGAANYHLSQVKKHTKNDPMIFKMLSLLERDDLNMTDRVNLNFALAKSFEDIGSHSEQFKFLDEGNNLRRKELNYSIERDIILFSKIKEGFNPLPSISNQTLSKPNSLKPIFIVGMPRSGTSLVHQILDSHNEVYGAGELNSLNKSIFPFIRENNNKGESGFSSKDLHSIREQYLDSLMSLNVKESVIVDKMPINFRYIGFILMAFPEAKILHMKRDSMATCWSIYKSFFNGNAYSFNQNDLAQYYGLYRDLMGFWDELFPNQIYDVCYEDLTTNQEAETRNLLKYCELEWDDNCLNFHKNMTAVKTTSSMQVRKKMYQGSSEVWKKYEAYLQPLIKGLNY